MKFLELTGYGNNFKHIMSLKSISDISFETNYTHIVLNNGTSVNVIENENEIIQMIYHLEGFITNKDAASFLKPTNMLVVMLGMYQHTMMNCLFK